MIRVNVIYHQYPHYRRPVMRELVKAGRHEYRFWGSLEDNVGIKAYQGDELVSIRPLSFHKRGRTWILKRYWPAVLDRSADVLVVHGHPNMPASWLIGIVGRLTGKKIVYWAHGWLKTESPLRAFIRKTHYGLAHRVMTYGDRARELAAKAGFPRAKVVPIYNSLDWIAAEPLLAALKREGRDAVRARLGIAPSTYRIICVARLIAACRFDQLIDAMATIKGRELSLCLIGDGPERAALEQQAARKGVNLTLMGALYDEAALAEQLFASDLSVSPGKIGLSAMHSMMYGTPVISHGDLDQQMPEVEAIVPGVTGDLFRRDDIGDLAAAIGRWMARSDEPRPSAACLDIIASRYNPVAQARVIDKTIGDLFAQGRTP